jgi:hypothetical protein
MKETERTDNYAQKQYCRVGVGGGGRTKRNWASREGEESQYSKKPPSQRPEGKVSARSLLPDETGTNPPLSFPSFMKAF